MLGEKFFMNLAKLQKINKFFNKIKIFLIRINLKN
ncbi:Hypothetical Protein SLY_0430 [Strawberry lethal yellows phytoplasma (CPA) str. NZSb11]|uniref:Uncharacterized protein n=1 Tax=Strawberry lethal yellows phytoplasma (CPA) str. NZSb11 TaxID=980422 RepID=R4RLY9_PHYAS|nr:Hypothetical Protein SLY_0430 [Strawberry lethal yellows phytoplasma (CPA) str. NZSb11]